jgi:YD repeat-containing protein
MKIYSQRQQPQSVATRCNLYNGCPPVFWRTLLLFLTFSYIIGPAQGQSSAEKQIIPPSPNAAAIAKYGSVPVSYYTGLVNIEVPIYTIQIRDITVPISLSYHAGGIKVSEEASRVGLGWSLSCGGQISRNIVNEDDFLSGPNGYLSPVNNSLPLPTGPLYTIIDAVQSGSKVKLGHVDIGITPVDFDLTPFIYGNTVDYEPDHFSYNFMGYSGKFIMTRDRTPVFEKQVKISMVPDLAGKTWHVKTADGVEYYFEESEYFVDSQNFGSQQISAWFLTKIRSLQGEEVIFHYEELRDVFIKPAGGYQQREVGMAFSCQEFSCKQLHSSAGPLPRKMYSNIFLSAITWKLGRVEFETASREDLEGDIRLKGIKVFTRNIPGQEYELQYEYRLGQSYFDYDIATQGFATVDVSQEHLRKRLKLDALTKFGDSTSSNPEWEYRFTYYEDRVQERLPSKNSFSRDHWGYYNGRLNNSLVPTHKTASSAASPEDLIGAIGNERDPSAEHMKAFSLKSITYPTGGTTSLSYEAHEYALDTTNSSPAVTPVMEQFMYDSKQEAGMLKSTTFDVSDEYVSSSGVPIPTEISALFRSSEPCASLSGVTEPYFEIVRESDHLLMTRASLGLPRCSAPEETNCISCNSSSDGGLLYKGSVVLPRGRYVWRAFVASSEQRFETIAASIQWWADKNKRSALGKGYRYGIAGGLRISKVSDFDPVVGRTHSRKFIYRQLLDQDGDGEMEEHSTGKLMSVPRYSYFDVFWERKELGPTLIPAFCFGCASLIRQSDSFIPASGSQGYAVGYSKVIEINGSVQEGGWTEYDYFNDKDLLTLIRYPHGNVRYPLRSGAMAVRPARKNGLLKQQTLYRGDSVPVLRTTNNYSEQFSRTYYGLETRRINPIGFPSSDLSMAHALLGTNADLLTITYPTLHSSLIFPSSRTEIHYDSAGNQTLTKTATSSYDNPVHLQLTRSTSTTSDLRTEAISYKYPADYDGASATETVRHMAGHAHMHSAVIEMLRTDETDVGSKILARTITLHDEFNGKILPTEIAELNISSPVDTNSIKLFMPALPYDTNENRLVQKFGYSSEGNLQQVNGAAEIGTSYLWGYEGSLPVAEVRNAKNTLFSTPATIESTETVSITLGTAAPTVSKSYTFTSDYASTVWLKLSVPGSPAYTTTVSYRGLVNGVTTLATGSCGSTIIPFHNIPAGTHTITLTLTSSGEHVGACGEIEFPKHRQSVSQSGIIEFFYEGFEDDPSLPEDALRSHTGKRYKAGDYEVRFPITGARQYRIEYWYLNAADIWTRVSRKYTGPTLLNDGGALDDIRIYPEDALMKTFTYGAYGVTSVINENGRTTIYEYDHFGRLSTIRDGDRNIEKAHSYTYRKQ